jgi:hypothetical protein
MAENSVTYRQWMMTTRSTLETNVQSHSACLKSSAVNFNVLPHHLFIEQKPSLKVFNLKLKAVLVIFLKATSYKMT